MSIVCIHKACNLLLTVHSEIEIKQERFDVVTRAIGTWSFSAHDFTDDELLYGAYLMLEHTLRLPGLEKWQLSKGMYFSYVHQGPRANSGRRTTAHIPAIYTENIQRLCKLPQL